MRYEGRFVVDAHIHITTLYKPKGVKEGWDFTPSRPIETFDNSAFTLYEMERYGVDMCVLLPSYVGTTNEMQAMLVDKYPDKFRAMCADQTLKIKVATGEVEWTLEAAVAEVEAALKTGKFVGIGEFVPRNRAPKHVYTLRERLDEFRVFMDLAAKYNVVVDFHEWNVPFDGHRLISQVAREYTEVPIIFCHGGHSIGDYAIGADFIRKSCAVAGRASDNVYLETGTWCAEYYEIALKNPNVGATQLIWTGGDYGNVPQYITSHPGQEPSSYGTSMKRWPRIPSYQTDWWGWALHQITKLRDWVTQDEINLILGGNAAKILKLPVPFERMFPEGRPDLWGIHWKKSIPFIPKDQVQHPDYP
jgi:predicted TIM-barrel fold metal-dependent hydrolase